MDYADNAPLVTGGASGIGRGIVEALAVHGVDVVLTYLSSDAGARETVAVAESHGVKAYAIQADLTDEAAVNHVVSETQRLLGGINILVANAGGIFGAQRRARAQPRNLETTPLHSMSPAPFSVVKPLSPA
jgi:NAD(P)-dependent dehydrogenase (short-subunit alcohol dehydrogenase family)